MPGYLYGDPGEGDWVRLEFQCRPLTASPTLTPATVATAFQRIPLPVLRSRTQPGPKTLVNLETIFFVEARPLRRTVSLLGQQVQLLIRPDSFRWEFGDGAGATTATPGAPYPSKEVVHRYRAARDVTHRVAVTWVAQWRAGRGTWQPVPGTVTTAGPATELLVVEAVPHLAGADR